MLTETEARPACKSEALKLAKRRWGKNIWARVNANAPGPEERAEIKARSVVRRARRDEIKAAMIATPAAVKDSSELLEAGKFVSDVHGDFPSISQLEAAVNRREAYLALKTEDAEIVEASKESNDTLFRKYNIVQTKTVGEFQMNDTKAEGDTWQEVIEKIRQV